MFSVYSLTENIFSSVLFFIVIRFLKCNGCKNFNFESRSVT